MAAQTRASRVRQVVSVGWALAPLLLAIPAPFCFAWAAHRLRSHGLALEAAGYAAATVAFFVLSGQGDVSDGAAGGLGLAVMGVATARAFMIRRRLFFPAPPAASTTWQPPTATPPDWHPSFPADHPSPIDPARPATWANPFVCTGHDRHLLSVPMGRMVAFGVLGLALVAIDVHLHVSGRPLGTGIGLMLAPVLAAMFSRRVDGPVLYYRNWGVEHELRLDTVTAVATPSGLAAGTTLLLSAPGLAKPVRIGMSARAFAVPPAARDHLRGWLERPGVQVSPAAALLLGSGGTTSATGRRSRVARAAAIGSWSLVGLALVAVVAYVAGGNLGLSSARLAVAGASGYSTATGPHGHPFAVGSPWGHPCEPIRLTAASDVPPAVYTQLATIVAEARRAGLNVVLEDRHFRWDATALRYPPGIGPADVPRVPVFADDDPPPSGNHSEAFRLGWDTRDTGSHEALTYVQARLHLRMIGADPAAERTALRRIVAFTQGISRTTRSDSGLYAGTTYDEFTPADVHAMLLMSGCTG